MMSIVALKTHFLLYLCVQDYVLKFALVCSIDLDDIRK